MPDECAPHVLRRVPYKYERLTTWHHGTHRGRRFDDVSARIAHREEELRFIRQDRGELRAQDGDTQHGSATNRTTGRVTFVSELADSPSPSLKSRSKDKKRDTLTARSRQNRGGEAEALLKALTGSWEEVGEKHLPVRGSITTERKLHAPALHFASRSACQHGETRG